MKMQFIRKLSFISKLHELNLQDWFFKNPETYFKLFGMIVPY